MSTLEDIKKNNQKLFVIYKMFAWDLLFYYAISFLFLTNVKGFQAYHVFFADAFYPIFKLLLQMPVTISIEKFGKRKCLIVANFCLSLYLFLLIILKNPNIMILANFFSAIGFTTKAIAETNLLYDSIDDSENKSKVFSKLEGRGNSLYYYTDSFSAILSGFLFMINGYIPILISLGITLFGVFLSFLFKEIPIEKRQTDNTYLKDQAQAFKLIMKSSRLKALILFNSVFASLLAMMVSLTVNLLNHINLSSKNIGIVFAILSLVAGFSSRYAYSIHLKYRNKSLSFLSVSFSLGILFSGLVVFIGLPNVIQVYLVLVILTFQYLVKGPFNTLIKQYLSNFSDSRSRIKIFSANYSVECIVRSVVAFACSFLVRIFSIEITHIFLGAVSTLVIMCILSYMKTRVGLKPENYKDSDILFYTSK